MTDRLDLLLLGASGLTGISCIPYIHKLANSDGRKLTWGVAGRSEEKLKQALEKAGKELDADFANIPIVVTDITDEESVKKMARSAKVVINCCGPYYFLGEPVVKACIEAGTHQVDVSAEPQHIEKTQIDLDEAAREKGVYIVNGCGMASIPADLGAVFLQQNFDGTLNSIVTYLEVWHDIGHGTGPSVYYGTWKSAVNVMGTQYELKDLRKKLFPKKLPTYEPKLKHKFLPHKTDVVKGWAVPFPSSDLSVLKRTQKYSYEVDSKRPIQIGTYFAVKSFFELSCLIIFGLTFGFLTMFSFGRKLLLNYPELFSLGFFSKKTPSKKTMQESWFQITLYGQGWKEKLANKDDQYTKPCDKSIVCKVKGRNPGYGASCACVVLAAIVILTEGDKLPKRGGVLTPAVVFAKTSLIKQLNENGVTFDVLSQKDI